MRRRALYALIGVSLLDTILPLPLLGIAAIYVVLRRPVGFYERVRRLYTEG